MPGPTIGPSGGRCSSGGVDRSAFGGSSESLSPYEAKPTEGFEPSTPALRERCSGQLSYVGG